MTKDEEIKAKLEAEEASRKAESEQRARELEEQRKVASEARERAAKAEGAMEALKTLHSQQSNTGQKIWGDEEWKNFEEKTGFTKEGITAIDAAVGTKINEVERKFEERTKQAEERARMAEDRYNSFEKTRNFESKTREYLSTKPQYAKYEKEITEFINDYPEETRKDPAKLAKLFDKAEIYIRGKVGEKGMRRSIGGSDRLGSDESGDIEDNSEVDLSGLRSFERATVERIIPSKEKREALKAHKHDLQGENGIMISGKEEWDKYNKK